MRAIRRGEVWLACLDPIVGREIAKTRPVLVVSNDVGNRLSGTVTVVPITSQRLEKIYPFEALLPRGEGGLPKDSKAKADQIRTLDASRLVQRLGAVGQPALEAVLQALRVHLDME